MSESVIMWGLNTALVGLLIFLISILGFFFKKWLTRIEGDIARKADAKDVREIKVRCAQVHEGVDELLHRHASAGSAGEVVPK
jgi:hypothetical protein